MNSVLMWRVVAALLLLLLLASIGFGDSLIPRMGIKPEIGKGVTLLVVMLAAFAIAPRTESKTRDPNDSK
jgi:hypothetical protein